MKTNELIDEYRETVSEWGALIDRCATRAANRLFDKVIRLSQNIRRGDRDVQNALLVLLNDVDPWVRVQAATDSLEFAPDEASKVLEHVAAAGPPGAVRMDAEMVLLQWREGTLKLP